MNKLPENITSERIINYLNGLLPDDESMSIQLWIDESDDNRKVFDNIKTIWIETGKLNPAPVDVNVDAAWEKLASKIESNERKNITISNNKKQTGFFLNTLLKVAAVLIPAIIILYFYFSSNKEVKQLAVVTTENTIQKKLPDGSNVRINTNSKITYPETFAKNGREVSLDGEAFFDVAPNKEKPFIIHANNSNIKVVGTSFNVNAYKENEDVEVAVSTGKVLLYGINKSTGDTGMVVLEPGDKGFFNAKTGKARKVALTNENDMFWMNSTLVFNKTKLSDVAKILNKDYKVSIILKNKDIDSLRLSATFKDQSIESVLDVISTTFNLKVTKNKSTFEIDAEGN